MVDTIKRSYLYIVLLIGVLLISMMPSAMATDESEFAGGSGTALDPYEIADADQLNHVRKYLSAHFELVANIDLSTYQAGDGWQPIGTLFSEFNGVFDGKGYTVTGLKIERGTESYVGLFGFTEKNAEIKNVHLRGVNVTGKDHVGALVGANKGAITNSSVTGEVAGGQRVGGLIGYVQKGTIDHAYAEVDVEGSKFQVGGLIGFLDGNVSHSYATGSVIGQEDTGGLVGTLAIGSTIEKSAAEVDVLGISNKNNYGGLVGISSGTIRESYATGSVMGASSVGGLVGYDDWGTILNGYATGSVTGLQNVGGLVGSGFRTKITNSYAVGAISGSMDVGGLAGKASSFNITNSFYDIDTTGQTDAGKGAGKSTEEMKDEITYNSWSLGSIWGIHPAKNGGYPYLQTIQKFVVYDGNGHSGGNPPIDPKSYRLGETVTVYDNVGHLEKDGHSFVGWNTQEDGSGTNFTAGDSFEIGNMDVTLYAQWEKNLYTVTFDANGGDTEADPIKISVLYEETIDTLPIPPTREGYLFTGWHTTNDGTGGSPFDADTIVTADITVYAQWEQIRYPSYTVTFDANGGDTYAIPVTMAVYHGETIHTLPIPPTREGYTFIGWHTTKDGEGGSPFDTDTIVTADITVYAQWEQVILPTYIVTFDANGGDSEADPVTMTVREGETIDLLPTPPTRRGYKFIGWHTTANGEGGSSFDTHTIVTADITVYAQWERTRSSSSTKPPVSSIPRTPSDEQPESPDESDEESMPEEDHQVTSSEQTTTDFSDIHGHWAEENIKHAASLGIISGYPDGTFKPGKPITRAEFTLLLVKKLNLQGNGTELNFTDTDEIGEWAKQSIALAVAAGLIQGYEDQTFRPNELITRAEMAVMVAKALNLPKEENHITSFADDDDIPAWAKEAVAILQENGYLAGQGDNKYHPHSNTTRAEAVVILLKILS